MSRKVKVALLQTNFFFAEIGDLKDTLTTAPQKVKTNIDSISMVWSDTTLDVTVVGKDRTGKAGVWEFGIPHANVKNVLYDNEPVKPKLASIKDAASNT